MSTAHSAGRPSQAADAEPRPELSVVIPCLNEAGSLPSLLAELQATFDAAGVPAEFILVDDGSTDASRALLREAALTEPRLRPVLRDARGGQTQALHDGLQIARADWVAHLDGDLQNDPRDLPALLAKAREGYDAVFGFRAARSDSLSRRLASRAANAIRKWVLRDSIVDIGCSTRVLRRDVLTTLPPLPDLHRYLPALVERAGWRILQVPTRHRPRQHGQSKYGNLGRALRGPADLLRMSRLARRLRRERLGS